jgi:hypothetical protein
METNILPQDASKNDANTAIVKTISLEDFKSVYYLLNAKPDRESKFFRESKIVSINDIFELNDSIQEKLSLHNIVTNKVSVLISLDNKRTFDFSTWEQFKREKWHTSALTKSITIVWDFNIKLESYNLPQRHTVKLRIGASLNPKDMIELVMNHEGEDQLHQAFAHSFCSIDFINPIISNEIFLIIETWHNALNKNFYQSKVQDFLSRNSKKIQELIVFLILVAACTLLFGFGKIYSQQIVQKSSSQIFSNSIGGILVAFLTIYIFFRLGKAWAQRTVSYIEKIQPIAIFKITRGDDSINELNKQKNNKFVKSLIEKFLVTIFYNLIAFLIAQFGLLLYNYFFK